MEYRKLGRSDIEVSSVCMGCWTIVGGNMWGPREESEAIATLHTAVDAGITFFDSAEGYGAGRSEELIGKAFKNMRDKVIVATKVSQNHLKPHDLRKACENSLKNLDMDYIDIYYLHWPNWRVPFDETMDEMKRLQSEGKIRHIGLSNFGRRDLSDMLEVGRCEINQLAYSLLFRAIEYEIAPVCVEKQVSIACYSPLLHGILAGKYPIIAEVPENRGRTRHFSSQTHKQTRHGGPGAEVETQNALDGIKEISDGAGISMAQISLAWLLTRPGVATVISGSSNPAQIKANAAVAEIKLSEDILDALDSVTKPLKEKLGSNADMWDVGDKCRIR
jgi:myo-inositol catabolism protein IolS